ncbi:MAG: CHAD domain-containing protein [Mariprofundus sp.]
MNRDKIIQETTAELYHLAPKHDRQSISNLLAQLGQVVEKPLQQSQCILKDSFDWRLCRAGLVLEEVEQDGSAHTLLRDIRSHSIQTYWPDRMANDDAGHSNTEWQRKMIPLLQQRALLPLLRRHNSLEEICLLNRDEKTVVRVSIEQYQVSDALNLSQPVGRFLRITAVRGYDKPYQRTCKHLRKSLNLKGYEPQSLYALCLQAIGRRAMDYGAKLNVQLDATMPAWHATRHIMSELFAAMQANEAGLLADIDSEFLHDFRIAVRRTRSALTQLKPVIPKQELAHFSGEFAWLGQITTPVRDLDVYLLNFSHYQQDLPASMQHELTWLHDLLKQRRLQAFQRMAWQIRSARYRRMKKQWATFLNIEQATDAMPKQANQAIGVPANRQIGRLFKQVLKQGSNIDSESPPEALHQLRKRCKKLRYMLDCFRRLYAEKAVRGMLTSLKKLQDNLGQFQDLAVEAATLHDISHQMAEAGQMTDSGREAIEALIEQIYQRQHAARQAYADSFKQFTCKKNRQRCERMLERVSR